MEPALMHAPLIVVEGVSFEEAREKVEYAAERIFAEDPTVRSVGVTRFGGSYGFRAVRNAGAIVPMAVPMGRAMSVVDVPVLFVDGPGEVTPLLKVPLDAVGSPQRTSVVPEVNRYRHLVSGLQVQNLDADTRRGVIDAGYLTVGTLGCFVRLASGEVGVLSNNHVLADLNSGKKGEDRILQPGTHPPDDADVIALLSDFVPLVASPVGLMPPHPTVTMNEVDAAVAVLAGGVQWRQGFLPFRRQVAPYTVAPPRLGDEVFKVGRTTGLTRGVVVDIGTVVGPVAYDEGPCFFRRAITIEGVGGTTFSDRGDSGSIIVRGTGEVVGLLFAGNGQQTYACPIESVMDALGCELAR
jgi:hypothetical protein